ncbi:zinc finger and SCAN domain-containing protein 12-like [Uranotaenia lowii]|uniref:zinc finger and SCAN domain-containing protein 12-like n=1 Tax=Uranotaenia lowii TaxID=190385 RepID=UPI0024797792|nr:zinc finger and SCAN domain-containing protein 12-like [Uranotaenia lowii]
MPRTCSVVGCRTHKDYYERGIRSYNFPRENKGLMVAWLRACGRSENYVPPKNATVCEKHFNPEDVFVNPTQSRAVPSLNLYWKVPKAEQPKQETVVRVKRKTISRKDKLKRKSELNQSVENVLVMDETSSMEFESEILQLDVNAFCRLCGVKSESEYKSDLDNFGEDDNVKIAITMCLVQDPILAAFRHVCENCYSEFTGFMQFIKICHNGQTQLASKLRVNQPEISESFKDASDAAGSENDEGFSLVESDDDTEPFDPTSFHDGETKEERTDRYVDILMAKLEQNKHTKSCAPRPYDCLDCGETFRKKDLMSKHRKSCLLIGSEESLRYKPYTCSICDKTVKSMAGYRYHLWTLHKDKFYNNEKGETLPDELIKMGRRKNIKCPLCNEYFEARNRLWYHLPSHKSTNSRVYRNAKDMTSSNLCSICGKQLSSAGSLALHIKFHNKTKDVRCMHCGKFFYTKSEMLRHVNIVHEKIRYSCDVCQAILISKETLYRHKKLHDESSLIYCAMCPKRFTNSNALKRHIAKRHEDDGITSVSIMPITEPVSESDRLTLETALFSIDQPSSFVDSIIEDRSM